MSRFSMRPGSKNYQSMNRTADRQNTSIVPRSVFSNSAEMPDMTAVGSFDDIDAQSTYARQSTNFSDALWNAIQHGARVCDLIKAAPEEVIKFLKTHAVKRLGSFKVKDADALLAFGDQIMLTRGLDTARDPEYQRNWEEQITSCVEKSSKRRRKFLEENPWEESVTVTAYVVNMEDAAAGFENGLLSPLVQKSQIGVTNNDIFDLHVVRAIIEYKWRNWARRYLIIEFALYLGWLFSFVAFLIIYIETDLKESNKHQSVPDHFLEVTAFAMDVLSVIFMLPFLVIEYNTICSYGMRWLQSWNLIDSIAYVLQFIISYYHLIDKEHIGNQHYDTLLATQCVLLFIKVQYFARVFGARTSFMELLTRVMIRARWFFVFIILTMISVALSFAVLYKEDVAEKDVEETLEDFKNVIRSVVTTYAILLGNFESDYVFDGSNTFVKGIFFLFFQVIMSITVLNLLIAVMTESYGTVTTESRIMYNIGRAQIMDELEVALPKRCGPNLKPFCHFLMVEQASEQDSSLDGLASAVPSISEEGSLRDEVKSLTKKIDVNTLVERVLPPVNNPF